MMAPKNVVEYSFKDGGFISVQPPSPTVFLVHLESCIILKDSTEALEQLAWGVTSKNKKLLKFFFN